MLKYITYTLIATASTISVVLAAILTNLGHFDLIDKVIVVLVAISFSIGLIKLTKLDKN